MRPVEEREMSRAECVSRGRDAVAAFAAVEGVTGAAFLCQRAGAPV